MSTETRLKEVEDYEKKKKSAEMFEDFCSCVMMRRLGIPLTNFKSKKLQLMGFENYQGIEIKYQPRFKNKENRGLYIEVAEKKHEDNKSYVSSGIMRDDNAWLFLMGNYETFYLISKKVLKSLYKNKYQQKSKALSTTKGFRLPIEEVELHCDLKLDLLKDDFSQLIPDSFYEDLKPVPRLEPEKKKDNDKSITKGEPHETKETLQSRY